MSDREDTTMHDTYDDEMNGASPIEDEVEEITETHSSKIKSRRNVVRSENDEDDESEESGVRKPRQGSRGSLRDRGLSVESTESDTKNKNRGNSVRDENEPPRRTQSVTSEGEESSSVQSAVDRRKKWEKQASKDYNSTRTRRESKPKAFGGSTGASILKSRFENKSADSQKVTTSTNRTRMPSNSGDGAEERHSTLSLKARFEAKMQDSAPVKRNFVINRSGGGAAKKFGGGAVTSNKCFVCSKTVYPMEKLEADKHVYHKFCFKCKTCNRTVGLGNYAALAGDIYCKPHLKQLFKLKGNYDEGFGREQRKADWIKKDANVGEKSSEEPSVNGESTVANGDMADDE